MIPDETIPLLTKRDDLLDIPDAVLWCGHWLHQEVINALHREGMNITVSRAGVEVWGWITCRRQREAVLDLIDQLPVLGWQQEPREFMDAIGTVFAGVPA